MNSSDENNLCKQFSTVLYDQTIIKEFDYCKREKGLFEKIQIQIQFTSDQKILYSQNGTILREVQSHDTLEKPETFNNLAQIRNLSWQGQLGKNKKKNGKWIAFWNKKLLKNVGGQKGQKLGYWKDLFLNYTNKAVIFETGEYLNGFRIGKWNYIYYNEKIVGGFYNKDGQKQGKWIDLDEGSSKMKKVTYNGIYNKNGMKVGKWKTMYCKPDEKEYKQIGGGIYNQEGNQKKIGKWVELDERFLWNKQITYNGQYNLNGMKIGRWDIKFCKHKQKEYQLIGGGSYDQEGNQKKIGKWIELDLGFQINKYITSSGEYNINGIKVGKWDIMYCLNSDIEFKQIGGGSYDQKGNQKKIGMWIELDKKFYYDKKVTYNGEYNMNGMKVGRWDIKYCKWEEEEYKQIGGGFYDQEGNQKKIGEWVELFEEFYYHAQVTYNGEYNMNGIKIGRWFIMFCKNDEKEFKQIGGGLYDQEGNQKKIGKWVELDDEFGYYKYINYSGQYNMKGMKIGRWDIMYRKYNEKEDQQIGGGSYDQEGNQKKIGKWVELDEQFLNFKQVTYNGEYNLNGMRVGKWDIMYCMKDEQEYKQIGSGFYDNEGNQKKIGKWIELDQSFVWNNVITQIGEYNMKGQKEGIWVEMGIENQNKGETYYQN